MNKKHIQKNCSNCGSVFKIVLIRESVSKQQLLMNKPCTECSYSSFMNKVVKSKDTCSDCGIPFSVSGCYAKGFCARCYQRDRRAKQDKTMSAC